MSVLTSSFTSLAARDADGMGKYYSDKACFSDPAFGSLDADEVRAMWGMLLGRSTDLSVTFEILQEDECSGSCEWHARYTFTGTGRSVHNVIRSEFVLQDNLIVNQRDRFGFWRWSRQALGMPGRLLGWSPVLRHKVRRSARAALARHMARMKSPDRS